MLEKTELKKALKQNLEWFENSGIMDPADGSWGVAERVVLTRDNDALEKTFTAFPAHSVHGDYALIEHRRPDCNFETALLFMLAATIFNEKRYAVIARNILHYLYRRSGMRNADNEKFTLNSWRWANEKWVPSVYFDDNAWNCVIPVIIANLSPELDKEFKLKESSRLLAEGMLKAFNRQFPEDKVKATDHRWQGDPKSPHWGSLACMAFACACQAAGNKEYLTTIAAYDDYLEANFDSFTTSEHAYIVIGSSAAAAYMKCERCQQTATKSANYLLSKQDQDTGNIPSEWGKEAPTGKHLVDTIYTQNWAVFGLQMLTALSPDITFRRGFEQGMQLLLKIQDQAPQKYLRGCWRGMYDLKKQQWGGGNRYEGGANSIYSGWTNAPIAIATALEITGKSLF